MKFYDDTGSAFGSAASAAAVSQAPVCDNTVHLSELSAICHTCEPLSLFLDTINLFFGPSPLAGFGLVDFSFVFETTFCFTIFLLPIDYIRLLEGYNHLRPQHRTLPAVMLLALSDNIIHGQMDGRCQGIQGFHNVKRLASYIPKPIVANLAIRND